MRTPKEMLGQEIRTMRRGLNMTLEEVSSAAKINLSTLLAIEKGRSDPKWSTVVAIYNVFGYEWPVV